MVIMHFPVIMTFFMVVKAFVREYPKYTSKNPNAWVELH